MPETNTELEDFKKLVVAKAMAAAKKHEWCEVVQKTLFSMGLGDYLPNSFVVQRKDDHGKWYDDASPTTTEKHAIRDAKSNRRYFVNEQKRAHLRRYAATSQSVYVEVGTETSLESAIDKVTSAHNRLIDAAKSAPKFEAPEYPKFRVVEKSARGKLLRAVAVAD